MFDFQIFFMIEIRDMKQQRQHGNDSISVTKRQIWNLGFFISVNMSVLENEYIQLCTIQDMKSFSMLLSTFQNTEQIKSGWAKLIFSSKFSKSAFVPFPQEWLFLGSTYI